MPSGSSAPEGERLLSNPKTVRRDYARPQNTWFALRGQKHADTVLRGRHVQGCLREHVCDSLFPSETIRRDEPMLSEPVSNTLRFGFDLSWARIVETRTCVCQGPLVKTVERGAGMELDA